MKLASEFFLKIRNDRNFRYFYALDEKTQLDRSKLVYNKDDLALTSSSRVAEKEGTQN